MPRPCFTFDTRMRSPSRAALCDPSLRSRRTARPSMETRKRKATKCVSHPKNVGKRSKAAISLTTSKVDDDVETRRPILVGRPDVLSFDALPDAVILAVIELLDVRDVVALARTCRRCRDVGLSLPMWRSHCKVIPFLSHTCLLIIIAADSWRMWEVRNVFETFENSVTISYSRRFRRVIFRCFGILCNALPVLFIPIGCVISIVCVK